jgi:hypothetical protein
MLDHYSVGVLGSVHDLQQSCFGYSMHNAQVLLQIRTVAE